MVHVLQTPLSREFWDSRHKRDTFYEAMTDQGLWRIPSGERVPNLSALHVGFLYGSSTLRVVPT